MGPPTAADEVVSRKAASIIARANPDYLVDVLSQHAGQEAKTEGAQR